MQTVMSQTDMMSQTDVMSQTDMMSIAVQPTKKPTKLPYDFQCFLKRFHKISIAPVFNN